MAGNATSASGVTEYLKVTFENILNVSTMFNCTGGNFEVSWIGEVDVPRTIFIGSNTTVKIVGNATTTSSDSEYDSSNGHSTPDQRMEELLNELSLPKGLTSAAVGPEISGSTSRPTFYVDGGELILENLIIRNDFEEVITNTTSNANGVYALSSVVTITSCVFKDKFAKEFGGGIFARSSTLMVLDSVFQGCRAGVELETADDIIEGAGGGIAVRISSTSRKCNQCINI